jgi:hypothetical protein
MDQTSFDDLLRVQRMMASKIMDETSMDTKIKLLDILRDIVPGKNKAISIEHVILEAEREGIIENEVIAILDDLIRDGMVREAGDSSIILVK